jgi:hypothetical protein
MNEMPWGQVFGLLFMTMGPIRAISVFGTVGDSDTDPATRALANRAAAMVAAALIVALMMGNGALKGCKQSLSHQTRSGAVTALVDRGMGTLTFAPGSGPQTITMPNPTGSHTGLGTANSLFIRTRNDSATETIALSDLVLDGSAIGGLSFGQLPDCGSMVDSGGAGQVTCGSAARPSAIPGRGPAMPCRRRRG